jgi:hypothetical protein
MTLDSTARASATRAVDSALIDTQLPVERTDEHTFIVTLEGAHKLRTTVSLVIGDHALSINAFVARRPDENAEAVYRWLLERNRRMYAVAFCIDHLGDIYLSGRISLEAVTPEEVDRILGCVAEYSDGSFNTILELGFATAIRREWKWRVDRGEPTGNLEAFRHLAEQPD